MFCYGTLAQGINMHCRTAIFAHSSEYLNVLNFRQMSGRAGRRGYDELGKVIFVEVPSPRIKQLMSAPSPSARGSFPFSISFFL